MRFSTLLSALAVIASTSAVVLDSRGDVAIASRDGDGYGDGYGDDAHSWAHGGQYDWPECTCNCLKDYYGCSENDDKCICSNAQWAYDNKACIKQYCQGDYYKQAVQAILSKCNDCGSPIYGWDY
ncbi:hypothetical protein GALMADRAFT_137089 [Galerina marginata CBS 339.88]|uniref:CFEM domain-containing protein n=1 Tax=Galerina marginata (strain CBS 339.88) TaxID=685588 RepID=A0A067T7T2_GALM3|nr:hypothetical protein GALMADRAFT_137089 [Galerina marginata CBS 339.88]